MKHTTKIALAASAALCLGLAGGASAQPQGYGPGSGGAPCYGTGPGSGMGPGPGMHGHGHRHGMHGWGKGQAMGPGQGMGPRGMFGARPGAVEERLAGLKSELKINAEQETAWQAFAAKAKQRATDMQAWFEKRRAARPAATLPERLDQQNEAAKQHQAAREVMNGAIKDLYASLTTEQKAIADQRLAGPERGMGQFRGGPGGRFR